LSRLPSSRGSSAPAPAARSSAAPAARRPGVLVQTPKSDIYVTMLGIALGAIFLASLLMVMLFYGYGFSTKVSSLAAGSQAAAIV
jgi:hypothetical protein